MNLPFVNWAKYPPMFGSASAVLQAFQDWEYESMDVERKDGVSVFVGSDRGNSEYSDRSIRNLHWHISLECHVLVWNTQCMTRDVIYHLGR